LDIPSAASLYFGNSRANARRLALLVAGVFLAAGASWAQLNTGILKGTICSLDGRPIAGSRIHITGGAGFKTVIHSNLNGQFEMTLPYGRYDLSREDQQSAKISSVSIFVAPLQITRVDLVVTAAGVIQSVPLALNTDIVWTDTTNGRFYPEALSLQGILLSREPLSVTQPLNFTGISDNRLTVESQRGFSWTDTQFKFHGIDATDSYQPGIPVVLPNVQALDAVVVRGAFAQASSSSADTEVGLFLSQPGASWHGSFSTVNTGAVLSSTNLPAPANRGLVQQPEQFRWITRDGIQIGGPLTKWADLFLSGNAQWAAQTEPLAAPGTNQRSRLLFGDARSRIRAGKRDQFDAIYSGSRIDLSEGGIPAGIEALSGNRMAPSFVLPGGFQGEPETDHLDFLQAGWTHFLSEASGLGAIEVRYGYSVAHLNTRTDPTGQSNIELLGGAVTGAPPLGNLAVRTHQEVAAAWTSSFLHANGMSHQVTAGGAWKTSEPRNRLTTPSNMNLISANGAPAFAMEFNTPINSRELVRSFSDYLADHITLAPHLAFDVGLLADFSRGSLPPQSSPGGTFVPARTFAGRPDLIVWNSISPRVGFAWQAPHLHGLVVRGTYFRLYAPLAARYLDFGNANSLGGSIYQWLASYANTVFQINNQGALLLRFGGPYSSISPTLSRPYSDEFDLGAEFPLARRFVTSVQLFRRDDKNRIAAIDTGVPLQAFTPVSISDPGSDGVPGTFDDQRLTVYAQNPGTFGQDRYFLTNPADLRMMNTGVLAEMKTKWQRFTFHASFVAEKSYGPTNPGDAFYENDPGVIGALFLDPNTTIHSSGRSFVDRAFVGKMQVSYRLPSAWGGIELASVADYTDGLVFARQLLVPNLPQGPLLVATTVRGSPEGGNRAEYVINWNLRISRRFTASFGRLALSADILNLTNAGQKLQEDDLSSSSFNLRLPVSIQPSRFVRLGFRYEF
jgi:hypothetical protein